MTDATTREGGERMKSHEEEQGIPYGKTPDPSIKEPQVVSGDDQDSGVCGAYKEYGLGHGGKGCGLSKGHEGNHRDG